MIVDDITHDSVLHKDKSARFASEYFTTHVRCNPDEFEEYFQSEDGTGQLIFIHEFVHFLHYATTPYGWDRHFRVLDRIGTLIEFIKLWKKKFPYRKLPIPLISTYRRMENTDPAYVLFDKYCPHWLDDYVTRRLIDGDYTVMDGEKMVITSPWETITSTDWKWHIPVGLTPDGDPANAKIFNLGARSILEGAAHIATHIANKEIFKYRSSFLLYNPNDILYVGASDISLHYLRSCFDSFFALCDLSLFGPANYLGSIKDLFTSWALEDTVIGHRFLRSLEVASRHETIHELCESGLSPKNAYNRFIKTICSELNWPTPQEVVKKAAEILCPMLVDGQGYGFGKFVPNIIARAIRLRVERPDMCVFPLQTCLDLKDEICLPRIWLDESDYQITAKVYRDVADDDILAQYACLSNVLIYGNSQLGHNKLSCSFGIMRNVPHCAVALKNDCEGAIPIIEDHPQKCFLTKALLTLGLTKRDLMILEKEDS